jgi:hypothetical protein
MTQNELYAIDALVIEPCRAQFNNHRSRSSLKHRSPGPRFRKCHAPSSSCQFLSERRLSESPAERPKPAPRPSAMQKKMASPLPRLRLRISHAAARELGIGRQARARRV